MLYSQEQLDEAIKKTTDNLLVNPTPLQLSVAKNIFLQGMQFCIEKMVEQEQRLNASYHNPES